MLTHNQQGICNRLWLGGVSIVLLFLLTGGDLVAQTWNLNSNGTWGTAGNWSPGTVPNAVDATATLGSVITANRLVTISSPVTVGSLEINDNNRYTVSGSTLTFDVSSGEASMNVAGSGGGSAGHVLNSAISLNDNLAITRATGGNLDINSTIANNGNAIRVASASVVRLDGAISGAGGLTVDGTGTVTMGGAANSYTGTTTVKNGLLNLSKATNVTSLAGNLQIGDGTGSAASARVAITNTGQIADSSTVTILSDGRLTLNASRSETIGALNSTSSAASVVLSASSTLTVGSGASPAGAFAGIISGAGLLTKAGTGTLELSGANTYSGRTQINGGTLRIGADNNLGTAPASATSGHLQFNNGTLDTTASFTLNANRRITLNAGGGTFSPDAGTTLTYAGLVSGTGRLTKSDAGTLRLSGGAGSNSFSGGTTVNGGTLALAKTSGQNAVGAGAITLNAGGTLLLENTNQIGDTTAMTLAGGAFSTGSGFSETLGALTLTADSSITLGAAIHNLRFGASNLASWTPGAQLTIYGWTGIGGSSGSAGKIFFGSLPTGLTSIQLSQISFQGYSGAQLLANGELVPMAVPEAQTLFAAIVLAALLGWSERRRIAYVLQKKTALATSATP